MDKISKNIRFLRHFLLQTKTFEIGCIKYNKYIIHTHFKKSSPSRNNQANMPKQRWPMEKGFSY